MRETLWPDLGRAMRELGIEPRLMTVRRRVAELYEEELREHGLALELVKATLVGTRWRIVPAGR